jgi:hypothetical protein
MILPEERIELVPALNAEPSKHVDSVPELMPMELVAMWNALDQEESFM